MHAGRWLASQFGQSLDRLFSLADLEQVVRWLRHHEEASEERHGWNGADYRERHIGDERADGVRVQETDGDEQLQERSQSSSDGRLRDHREQKIKR